jgi:hypothetical protein
MDMFLKIYQPKRGKNPMANLKGMPLCIIGSNQKKMLFVLFCETELFLILKSFYLAEKLKYDFGFL